MTNPSLTELRDRLDIPHPRQSTSPGGIVTISYDTKTLEIASLRDGRVTLSIADPRGSAFTLPEATALLLDAADLLAERITEQ